jgi:FkbM family methyltransferase
MILNRDRVRTLLRAVAPKTIYKLGARLLDAFQVVRRQGFAVHRTLRRPAANAGEIRSVRLRDYRHPVWFRAGTPDVSTIVQNLVREEYGQLPANFIPEYIVDAGAYIGDITLYFLNRFPNARAVSLEPNQDNYALAQRNLEPYGDRVRLLQKGLWSSSRNLTVAGSFTGSRLQDSSAGGTQIPCTDVNSLMDDFSMPRLDLLKMDIEGAEAEVLLVESERWLNRTNLLIVEYHGDEIASKCRKHLHAAGFDGFTYRNLTYHIRKTEVARST